MNERVRVVVATGNPGKVKEFRALFADTHLELLGLTDVPPVPEVIEDGDTFTANAIKKAESARDALECWVLADDSGLVVDALDGAPGVHSARYAGVQGDDAANNRKLMRALEGVADSERSARFVCVLALARPGEPTVTFEGRIEGRIGHVPRGSGGFGYDVLFLPTGSDRTTAEMEMDEKGHISHRGEAARAFLDWLSEAHRSA